MRFNRLAIYGDHHRFVSRKLQTENPSIRRIDKT
jgi:hypothetical protein